MGNSNPLINYSGIPHYDLIKGDIIEAAVEELVVQVETSLREIETDKTPPSWHNVVVAMDDLEEKIHKVWGPIVHLKSVRSESTLRAAIEKVQPKLVSLGLKVDQSKGIFEKLKHLKNSDLWDQFLPAQKRSIEKKYRAQKLSGIDLESSKQKRFNEIEQKLSDLSTKFSNNLLDATKAWSKIILKKDELKGLSESAFAQLSQNYSHKMNNESSPQKGPWLLTLDLPSYIVVMENCENRNLREELYNAYLDRASFGEFDNTQHIISILRLRQERAKLLGYDNHAMVSLANKMAENVGVIYELQDSMRESALSHAKNEFQELKDLASSEGFQDEIKHWDLAYWSKRLEEKKYAFTESELKPYFALPNVLNGMFALVNKLFRITIESADGDAPIWHKDVRYYKIRDENNQQIASFFLDPFSRPENKRGGAWMDVCVNRKRLGNGQIQKPVAYLVCNGTPPVGTTPSLMTFREVETLFHEFGHGLQHMLTNVDVFSVAGIHGVEWDAVEIPSQFMENWCYHKQTLLGLAKHYETGEAIPVHQFEKLRAAKNHRSGHQILRQLGFGYIDLKLHTDFDPFQDNIFDAYDDVMEEISYMPKCEKAGKFLCGFGHIFAGGYSAGYYSYLWSNVLSSDAFEAFEDVGLENEAELQKVGRKFRDTILGKGGSVHPSEVFQEFRGRKPRSNAFMRHNGLLAD